MCIKDSEKVNGGSILRTCDFEFDTLVAYGRYIPG